MKFLLILIVLFLAACSSTDIKLQPEKDVVPAEKITKTSDKNKSDLTKNQSDKQQSDSKMNIAEAKTIFMNKMLAPLHVIKEADSISPASHMLTLTKNAFGCLKDARTHLSVLPQEMKDQHFKAEGNLLLVVAKTTTKWFSVFRKPVSKTVFKENFEKYGKPGIQLCELGLAYAEQNNLTELKSDEGVVLFDRIKSSKAGFENLARRAKEVEKVASQIKEMTLRNLAEFDKHHANGTLDAESAVKSINKSINAIDADLAVLEKIEDLSVVDAMKDEIIGYKVKILEKRGLALQLINFQDDFKQALAAFDSMLSTRSRVEYVDLQNEALSLCNKNVSDERFVDLKNKVLSAKKADDNFISASNALSERFKKIRNQVEAISATDLEANQVAFAKLAKELSKLVEESNSLKPGMSNYATYHAELLASYRYHAHKQVVLANVRLLEASLVINQGELDSFNNAFSNKLKELGKLEDKIVDVKAVEALIEKASANLAGCAGLPGRQKELVSLHQTLLDLISARAAFIKRIFDDAKFHKAADDAVEAQKQLLAKTSSAHTSWLNDFNASISKLSSQRDKLKDLKSRLDKVAAAKAKAWKDEKDQLAKELELERAQIELEAEKLKEKKQLAEIERLKQLAAKNKKKPTVNPADQNTGTEAVVLVDKNKSLWFGLLPITLLSLLIAIICFAIYYIRKGKQVVDEAPAVSEADKNVDKAIEVFPTDIHNQSDEPKEANPDDKKGVSDETNISSETNVGNNELQRVKEICQSLSDLRDSARSQVVDALSGEYANVKLYFSLAQNVFEVGNIDVVTWSSELLELCESQNCNDSAKILYLVFSELDSAEKFSVDPCKSIFKQYFLALDTANHMPDLFKMAERVKEVEVKSFSQVEYKFVFDATREALELGYEILLALQLPAKKSANGIGGLYAKANGREDEMNVRKARLTKLSVLSQITKNKEKADAVDYLQCRLNDFNEEIIVKSFKCDTLYKGISDCMQDILKALSANADALRKKYPSKTKKKKKTR